jgi:hypothetical protein
MFWLKSCPKCDTGDLYDGQDQYGRYIACLQCGHYLTEVEEVVLRYVARTARIQPSHAPWVGWDATSPMDGFNQAELDRGASVAGKSLVEAVPGILAGGKTSPPGQSNSRAGVA